MGLNLVFCDNCRFWNARDLAGDDGLCRYFPPSMVGNIAPHGNAIMQQPQVAIWPITRCDDWCGRFEARKTLEEAIREAWPKASDHFGDEAVRSAAEELRTALAARNLEITEKKP